VSPYDGAVPSAVIVPVKAFGDAKARLRPVLTDERRADVARRMATHVIESAGELAVFVVCDDHAVAEWATNRGASVVWSPARGLNPAVDVAVHHAGEAGFDHIVIAHADLPVIGPLAAFAVTDTIVLAPDHRLDGTNVMAFPIAQRMPASYGAGSFRRHLNAALARPVPVEVRRSGHTERDVDLPADLDHPAVAERLRAWGVW
jgi:2-phospho-L-lactate/phosphoenolpyruvate guanylyltransferase